MPACPVCGNESQNKSININSFTLHYPCDICKAHVNVLMKPYSKNKTVSLKWASDLSANHSDPLIRSIAAELINYTPATSPEGTDGKDSGQKPSFYASGTHRYLINSASDTFLRILKPLIIGLFVLQVISCGIAGMIMFKLLGFIIGLILGALYGGLTFIIGMTFIEASENAYEANRNIQDLKNEIKTLKENMKER